MSHFKGTPKTIKLQARMRPVAKGVATLLIPQLQGLKGPKGDTGERGTSGPQGTRGESGLPGTKGDSGERGQDGLAGINGSNGIDGQDGTNGTNGIDGQAGADGLQGEQGLQGIQGIQGESGAPGTTDYNDLENKPTLGTLAAQNGTFSGTSSGTNTGDNATNTQYSGLSTSKQDTLVSATNIKTINGSSVLGAGNLVVSGAVAITQTEVDFGSTPVSEALFTITEATATATSKIIGSVAYAAPTGKDLDELEMDSLELKFGPKGVGEFYIYARGMDGYVADKFKINYQIAA